MAPMSDGLVGDGRALVYGRWTPSPTPIGVPLGVQPNDKLGLGSGTAGYSFRRTGGWVRRQRDIGRSLTEWVRSASGTRRRAIAERVGTARQFTGAMWIEMVISVDKIG
jgi:hypothetical protein